MAADVTVKKIPPVEVKHSDIQIEIKLDGEKLGELHISKGGLAFYEKGAQKKHFSLTWKKFAEAMTKEGKEHK